MYRFSTLRLVLLAASLVGAPAFATTMLRRDYKDLAKNVPVIVRGKVTAIHTRWSGDHLRILTDIDVQVTESLKGSPGASVRITQPGGQVGDIGQHVSGLAAFTQGEEVVLFLERQGTERYLVAGMTQGKFRVSKAPNGKLIATPETGDDALILDPSTRAPVNPSRTPMALEDFRTEIRKASGQKP